MLSAVDGTYGICVINPVGLVNLIGGVIEVELEAAVVVDSDERGGDRMGENESDGDEGGVNDVILSGDEGVKSIDESVGEEGRGGDEGGVNDVILSKDVDDGVPGE